MNPKNPPTPRQPLALAVLISGTGTNLQAIMDAIQNGLCARILSVISNHPQAYGLERAHRQGIPTLVIPHTTQRKADEQVLCAHLDQIQPDLILLAGFMRVLSRHFIQRYAPRILNLHPSLLPKYKGLDTHTRVLADGETEHGCSIHVVTPGLDTGPTIAQSRLQIIPNETPVSLTARVRALEHQLYPRVIELYAQGRLELGLDVVKLDGQPLPPSGLQIQFDLP